MKTLLEGSRKTDPDESPSRNHSTEINSRTRLKSEPSQPSRLTANSGRLPGIESMLKKNLQAQNNDNSFIKKGTKIDSKTKDRNQITNESFLINGKSKHKPSLNGYGNPKFYLPGNPTFQEVHNQKPIRGTALNAKETTDKSPYQGQREASNSMKPGSRQSTRAAALLFEKTLNQEYQFQFASRNNPRLNSNLNLKPKKPTYFQKEAFSNSMNISGEGIFLDPSKNSSKKNGILEAYAANSNKGLVRNYNEDRVSIILNIVQPSTSNYQGEWPLCSFFGIYDGHGGSRCADFLKETLHKYVIGNKNFPENPVEALREAFKEAENDFIEMAQRNRQVEQSGSCALVIFLISSFL